MPPLVVVADGAVGLEAEPLRDGLVLLLLDGQRPLGAESLVRRLLRGGVSEEEGESQCQQGMI